jgi:hypothetical protein
VGEDEREPRKLKRGSGTVLVRSDCHFCLDRSYYRKKKILVERSCEEDGSSANTGFARWIRSDSHRGDR